MLAMVRSLFWAMLLLGSVWLERWKSRKIENGEKIEKWKDEKILIFLILFGWEWKSGRVEKVSLHKFTHIPLLKNDAQFKQKSDKQPKK